MEKEYLLVPLGLLALYFLWKISNLAAPTRYEWLELLSYNWKPSLQLLREMRQKKSGRYVGPATFYGAMHALVKEGLTEERADPDCKDGAKEYRLTSSGGERRRKIAAEKVAAVTGKTV